MKQVMQSIGKIGLMIVGGALVATVLLTLVFLVPVNQENKAQSMQVLKEEGWYPLATVHKYEQEAYFHSDRPDVMDNNTDSIMMSISMDEQPGNPLVRAMNMYNEYMGKDYGRYWQGYVVVLRPLLAVFNYAQVRVINTIVQLLLVCFFARELWQKKGKEYALLMFTSYVLLMPLALFNSLCLSVSFYVSIIGSMVLLKGCDKWKENARYAYVFVGIGMATSFVDILTYPLYTFGIPMVWWLLVQEEEKNIWQSFKQVVLSGMAWLVGYLGFWFMKWALATVITGRNIFAEAADKIGHWSASEEGAVQTFDSRMQALSINWQHYSYPIYMAFLIGWVAYLIFMLVKKGMRISKVSVALLVVASSAVVWYFFISEHTKGHHFSTYRIWGVTIFAVLAVLLQARSVGKAEISDGADEKTSQQEEARHEAELQCEAGVQTSVKKKHMWISLVLAVVMAAGLTLSMRENIVAFDGNVEYEKVELEEGSVATMNFTPTFSNINSLTLCMSTEGDAGAYEVLIRQGEEVLYVEQIPVTAFCGRTYTDVAVDWHLKARETYALEIRQEGAENPAYLLMTKPGVMPLNEMRGVAIDGQAMEGQPVMGFTYHTLPTSKVKLGYHFVCYSALSLAVVIAIWALIEETRTKKEKNTCKKDGISVE